MIYLYFGYFMMVFFVALFWYAANEAVTNMLSQMQAIYPGHFSGVMSAFTTFLQAIWTWLPLIMLLVGFIWILVNAQRRGVEGYL